MYVQSPESSYFRLRRGSGGAIHFAGESGRDVVTIWDVPEASMQDLGSDEELPISQSRNWPRVLGIVGVAVAVVYGVQRLRSGGPSPTP